MILRLKLALHVLLGRPLMYRMRFESGKVTPSMVVFTDEHEPKTYIAECAFNRTQC